MATYQELITKLINRIRELIETEIYQSQPLSKYKNLFEKYCSMITNSKFEEICYYVDHYISSNRDEIYSSINHELIKEDIDIDAEKINKLVDLLFALKKLVNNLHNE